MKADKLPEDTAAKNISVNLSLGLPKKEIILKAGVWLLIVVLAVAIWKWPAKNTIPADVRSQVSFHTIFPTKNYDPTSFQVVPNNHTLQFKVSVAGISVLVTEQPLPANSGDNPAQDPAQMLSQLGVRYFSQIQSRLGVVSVAKFWTNTFLPYGPTGILGKNGTLVLARPDKDLSPSQWIQVFDNLSQ